MAKLVIPLIPEVAEKYTVKPTVESMKMQIAGVPGGEIDLTTITLAQVNNLGGLTAVLSKKKEGTQ